jgi:hypothetical protein
MPEVSAVQSMLKYCQETFRADTHKNFSKLQWLFGISGVGGGAFG